MLIHNHFQQIENRFGSKTNFDNNKKSKCRIYEKDM